MTGTWWGPPAYAKMVTLSTRLQGSAKYVPCLCSAAKCAIKVQLSALLAPQAVPILTRVRVCARVLPAEVPLSTSALTLRCASAYPSTTDWLTTAAPGAMRGAICALVLPPTVLSASTGIDWWAVLACSSFLPIV